MSDYTPLFALKARMVGLGLLSGICKCCIGSFTALPVVLVAFLFIFNTIWEAIPTRTPPVTVQAPTPDSVDEENDLSEMFRDLVDPGSEITQMAVALDKMAVLLQKNGDWVERTGTACLESFEDIYKQQRNQLKQHTELKQDYSEQLARIVNILDGHRDDIAEASRAAAENNTSLCNIIAQHRRDFEENQKTVAEHASSVNKVLLGQEEAIASAREHVAERTGHLQTRLDGHAREAEENRKLVREHGASISRVVSDHAGLVAGYQAALDGMVSLNTANSVFALVHCPCGWEAPLGDFGEDLGDDSHHQTAQERRRMGVLRSGAQQDAAAAASMVDNVQELSRTFRGTSNQAGGQAQATPAMMEQIMATVLRQVQDTVQAATVKGGQHHAGAEEGGTQDQLRKAQEDIAKLRADLGEIQEFRQLVRDREEIYRERRRILEILEIIRDDPERIQQDPELRAEVDKVVRGVDADAIASSPDDGKAGGAAGA